MSKLPNANKAIIDSNKIRSYLLSTTHTEGRYKATFFRNIGYNASNWEVLKNDLQKLVLSHNAIQKETNIYGKKFLVKGKVKSPSGKTFNIQTIWIILEGEDVPRFITAYSGGKK